MTENQQLKSTITQIIGLVVSVVLCFAAAAIGSFSTLGAIDGWYTTIIKPTWNPPNWIFGPVWSTLYLMMAVSAWLVWKQTIFATSKTALGCFAVQLTINVLWSIVFFGFHLLGWAVIVSAALWLAIILTILLFWRHSKLAAGLLVPYLLWVSFATFLSYTIWTINRVG